MTSTIAIWLILGAGLCLTELVFPTAFIALMMGLSAFVVALLAGVLGLWLQVVAWVTISFLLVLVSRRFAPKPNRQSKIKDAVIAETTTEILPGKPGRVMYEGNSWRARCDDDKLYIGVGEPVYVVQREGTTLIVMPQSLLNG